MIHQNISRQKTIRQAAGMSGDHHSSFLGGMTLSDTWDSICTHSDTTNVIQSVDVRFIYAFIAGFIIVTSCPLVLQL